MIACAAGSVLSVPCTVVFAALLGSVKPAGLFTGQLFGLNDSWNTPESGMNFHSRSDVEQLLRGWTVLDLTEEDRPGKTKLGEDKHGTSSISSLGEWFSGSNASQRRMTTKGHF